MQKVLLIDDFRFFHVIWMWRLREHFQFLHATTVEQARNILCNHNDISAIVVDAHLGGQLRDNYGRPLREWGLDTSGLVAELKDNFRGPIIAAPSQPWHFKPMMHAGCTHYVWKWRVAPLLRKLLLTAI